MKKVYRLDKIPEKSVILSDFGKVDYADSYQIRISANGNSVDKVTTDIFKTPHWADNLMKLRDFIVKPFGLKTGDKTDIVIEPYYPIGSKAVYFTVLERNENEIVMAENDKHLNFRTSVMVDTDTSGSTIYLSTIVQFNNFYGKLYFLPVKPFHQLMIRSLLKEYANEN